MCVRKRAAVVVRGLIAALGPLCVGTSLAAQDPGNARSRVATPVNHSAPIGSVTTAPVSTAKEANTTRWQVVPQQLIPPQPPFKAPSPVAADMLRNRPGSEGYAESASPIAPIARSMAIHWDDAPDWMRVAPPGVMSAARQFRRRGLPLVRLWQSPHLLLALGLNNRARPGIYLTQKLTE
jgi:hypothetical protein